MIEDLFAKAFAKRPTATARAPGRVNLIGEHTDYNGGMVLPTALGVGLEAALAPRDDAAVRIASDRFAGLAEAGLTTPAHGAWSDYALGAVIYAQRAGYLAGGADLYVLSSIPDGAGLSSSAALIVATLKAARDAGGADASDVEIAQLARRVENEFISMPCGIMDQMAVAVAREGQAIALDTKTLAYDLIDLPSKYDMTVIHSGCHRKLSDGRYAARKHECDAAQAALGGGDLCLLTDAMLDKAAALADPLARRARHCASEHRRTVKAAAALKAGDIAAFGALMNESHISMRDDFEMSLPAIDALVESAVAFGAVGARLTGGGFGGCIVACVEKDKVPAWREKLLAAHPAAYAVT